MFIFRRSAAATLVALAVAALSVVIEALFSRGG
jgi:hypothetical protein